MIQDYGITRPRGLPKNVEPLSFDCQSATALIRKYGARAEWGDACKAVGWEKPDGPVIALAVEWPNGRRADLRFLSGGRRKVTFRAPTPPAKDTTHD